MSVEDAVSFEARKDAIADAIQKGMAKKGALKLPPLLDERRLHYLIPDQAFEFQPLSDRVLVAQLDDGPEDNKFIKGGLIEMTQQAQSRKEGESPRGIIVGAGLLALDALRSNGVDLGHIVCFTSQMPWTLPCGRVGEGGDSIEYKLFQMVVADISGSLDTRKMIVSGELEVVQHVRDDGVTEHHYKTKEGKTWNPILPYGGNL